MIFNHSSIFYATYPLHVAGELEPTPTDTGEREGTGSQVANLSGSSSADLISKGKKKKWTAQPIFMVLAMDAWAREM